MEHRLHLQAPWEDVKEKLKEINTELSDEDLAYMPGEEESLLQRLAKKLKKEPAEIRSLIESVSYNKGKAS